MKKQQADEARGAERAEWEVIEEKIREHRYRRRRITVIIVLICAGLAAAVFFYARQKQYDDYVTTSQTERTDSEASHYLSFAGGIIKCTNDGVSYIDFSGDTVWNQVFEMESPVISICDGYAAVADQGGDEVCLLDEKGLVKKMSVKQPVERLDVSAMGTLAVLTQSGDSAGLKLFDSDGEMLAEGAVSIGNGGAPLDLALSHNGKLMAISVLDISEGSARTVLNFYNFGSAGQSEKDNLVASISREGEIIPEIDYVSDVKMLALGDAGVYVYEGADVPSEAYSLNTDEEIAAIVHNDVYFGLEFASSGSENGRSLHIYNMKCSEIAQINPDMSYETVCFLNNREICLYDEYSCAVYGVDGREKFSYTFDNEIRGIFRGTGYLRYTFLLQERIEKARLKLFALP